MAELWRQPDHSVLSAIPTLVRMVLKPVPAPTNVRTAEAALRRAQLASDVATLATLLDDALVFTGPDGALYSKQDDLDAHHQGAIRITQLEPIEEHVQDFGDTVVVSVHMAMRGSFKGASFAGPFRYTRIWHRRPDGWRVVAGHVSAISSE